MVDYRQLNKITIKDTFLFPNLWKQLQSIGRKEVFSQLDLRQGYHQIALTPRASELTTFVLPQGQYQYLRVPFGLTNAPRVFQRTMQQKLGHLDHFRIFLDDILVISDTEEEHTLHLLEVLKIMTANNMSISTHKSHLYQE